MGSFPTFEYENCRRVCYGQEDDETMMFVPVCKQCGRFVKADSSVSMKQAQEDLPTATCSIHGRVSMLFEGFF